MVTLSKLELMLNVLTLGYIPVWMVCPTPLSPLHVLHPPVLLFSARPCSVQPPPSELVSTVPFHSPAASVLPALHATGALAAQSSLTWGHSTSQPQVLRNEQRPERCPPWQDTDMVHIRNPLPYLAAMDADVAVTGGPDLGLTWANEADRLAPAPLLPSQKACPQRNACAELGVLAQASTASAR